MVPRGIPKIRFDAGSAASWRSNSGWILDPDLQIFGLPGWSPWIFSGLLSSRAVPGQGSLGNNRCYRTEYAVGQVLKLSDPIWRIIKNLINLDDVFEPWLLIVVGDGLRTEAERVCSQGEGVAEFTTRMPWYHTLYLVHNGPFKIVIEINPSF